MAYVRKKKVGKHEYYQLVEGHRDKETGKVRQKVLRHLGKHDSKEAAKAYADSVVTKEETPWYVERLEALERAHHSTDVDESVGAMMAAGEVYDGLSAEEQKHVRSLAFGVIGVMLQNRKTDAAFGGLGGFYQH